MWIGMQPFTSTQNLAYYIYKYAHLIAPVQCEGLKWWAVTTSFGMDEVWRKVVNWTPRIQSVNIKCPDGHLKKWVCALVTISAAYPMDLFP